MATTATARLGAFSRIWAGYLRQLEVRPIRTKMLTSGFLFGVGDSVAQFGLEGKRIGAPEPPDDDVNCDCDDDVIRPWDPIRAARLMVYGGIIFGPLAHTWLTMLEKVRYPSRFKTLAARLALDQFLWGPTIVSIFWAANGVLEGKTPEQVKTKVIHAFPSAYARSIMVFAPSQILNFTLVPLHHRLAFQQAVGLGWNISLSYYNNLNNKRLAAAEAALALAQAHAVEASVSGEDDRAAAREVALASAQLEKAKAKRHKLHDAQGGGATGVGTRMGW